jgi:hypothetical protein
MAYLQEPRNWLVVLATLVIVALCVALHYEVLAGCNRYLPRLSGPPRRRLLSLMFAILAAHIAEIWLFGLGYFVLARGGSFGSLMGLPSASLPDYVYFSAIAYSTVGFGDIVPVGAIRLLAGVEAVVGLVMIGWSASYTFLAMERNWRNG